MLKFYLRVTMIRNIVLKDILRHSCLIAVTKPSDRYLTIASAAFCRHTWCFINLLIIIKRTDILRNTSMKQNFIKIALK